MHILTRPYVNVTQESLAGSDVLRYVKCVHVSQPLIIATCTSREVLHPNMSGLNPVCNYEYSVSLKLNTQQTTLSFLGSYRRHSQNHSASRVTNEEEMMTEQQNLKKPNHQQSSVAKYTHVEPSSHATDVTGCVC